MKLLNLGCGRRFRDGWVNVDFIKTGEHVVACNLLEGIPFESDSFDLVYHSHVLEHFTKEDGRKFIQECRRVLKPGGIIRIVVPDLEKIARTYLHQLEQALVQPTSTMLEANHEWMVLLLIDQAKRNVTGGEMVRYLSQNKIINQEFIIRECGIEMQEIIEYLKVLNKKPVSAEITQPEQQKKRSIFQSLFSLFKPTRANVQVPTLSAPDQQALSIGKFRMSGEVHQWMYDQYSLGRLLESCNFQQILRQTASESYLDSWLQFCLDTNADGSAYKPESLYMEAIK